jgi:hypothetical protein
MNDARLACMAAHRALRPCTLQSVRQEAADAGRKCRISFWPGCQGTAMAPH